MAGSPVGDLAHSGHPARRRGRQRRHRAAGRGRCCAGSCDRRSGRRGRGHRLGGADPPPAHAPPAAAGGAGAAVAPRRSPPSPLEVHPPPSAPEPSRRDRRDHRQKGELHAHPRHDPRGRRRRDLRAAARHAGVRPRGPHRRPSRGGRGLRRGARVRRTAQRRPDVHQRERQAAHRPAGRAAGRDRRRRPDVGAVHVRTRLRDRRVRHARGLPRELRAVAGRGVHVHDQRDVPRRRSSTTRRSRRVRRPSPTSPTSTRPRSRR